MNRSSPKRPRPRRSLGQHFLHDARVLARIRELCELSGEDLVFEVGPGAGSLTAFLLARAGRIIALEQDRRLCEYLQTHFPPGDRLTIREADASRFDYPAWVPPGQQAVVAGNLPFNMALRIYGQLLHHRHCFRRMVLMFQQEVAERLVAPPGSRRYGLPSLRTRLYTEAELAFRVGPEAFRPRPRVKAAVVVFTPLAAPREALSDEAGFFHLVEDAFRFRRKTLYNSLKRSARHSPDEVTRAIKAAGIDGGRRPETLGLEEYARLFRALCG